MLFGIGLVSKAWWRKRAAACCMWWRIYFRPFKVLQVKVYSALGGHFLSSFNFQMQQFPHVLLLCYKKKKANKKTNNPKRNKRETTTIKITHFPKITLQKCCYGVIHCVMELSISTAGNSPGNAGNVSGCCKSFKALKCFTEPFPGDTDSLSAQSSRFPIPVV